MDIPPPVRATLEEIAQRVQQLPVAYYTRRKMGGEWILNIDYPDGYTPPKGAVASLEMARTVVLVKHETESKLFQAIER